MGTIIFGAGFYGTLYYQQCIKRGEKVLAFADNNVGLVGSYIESAPIISPQDINKYPYEKIVISVSNKNTIAEITRQLAEYGICEEKIEVLVYSSFNPFDEATDSRVIWLRDFANYICTSSIPGNTAECGVFRGYFASYINKYFQDRKLYLFDTFDGFDINDFEVEIEMGDNSFIGGRFSHDAKMFSATSEGLVMRYMPNPGNCIVKKGYFPETAVDVLDTFCFVNLDMDLYQPMLAGLRFFWDKITPKGVMLLHDYFGPELPGVKQAVSDFEDEIKRKIHKVPIGDSCSIALIKGHDF